MWCSIKLILYYFGYQLLFSAIGMGLSYLFPHLIAPTDIRIVTLAMVASSIAMMVHLIRFHYVKLKRPSKQQVNIRTLLLCIPFIYAAMYLLNVAIEAAHIPNTMEDSFIAMSHNGWGILSICVLAPILEEMLFRGAVEQRLLHTWRSPWTAILISSLLFGIVHMNPAQIPFAFLIGIMFGWLYYRTGSIIPGIVGHIFNNTLATISMLICGDSSDTLMGDDHVILTSCIALIVFISIGVVLHHTLPQPTAYYREKNMESEQTTTNNDML